MLLKLIIKEDIASEQVGISMVATHSKTRSRLPPNYEEGRSEMNGMVGCIIEHLHRPLKIVR